MFMALLPCLLKLHASPMGGLGITNIDSWGGVCSNASAFFRRSSDNARYLISSPILSDLFFRLPPMLSILDTCLSQRSLGSLEPGLLHTYTSIQPEDSKKQRERQRERKTHISLFLSAFCASFFPSFFPLPTVRPLPS